MSLHTQMMRRCKSSTSLIDRFFVPSIMHFRKQNNLFLLCLSNGDFEGLGRVREKELQASAKYLGFQEAECINDPELQDGMK